MVTTDQRIKVMPLHRIRLGDHDAQEFLVTEWGQRPYLQRATMVSAYYHRDHEEDTHIFIGRTEIDADTDHRYLYMAVLLGIGLGIFRHEWTADELEAKWAAVYG